MSSAAEIAMRKAVAVWGRARWPGARVVHELVVGQRRIDMAFILRDHLVGVEIKSARDVIDRLDGQLETFAEHIPEVWLAIDRKWTDQEDGYWSVGRVTVCGDVATDGLIRTNMHGRDFTSSWPARIRRRLTVQMLDLLWASELQSIAARHGLGLPKRAAMGVTIPAIARALTGDQIVAAVCAELRARKAFPRFPASDAPIPLPHTTPTTML
ncbi:MAG: hypothetical protein DI527_00555 [Chelatococcus sp.]|nr:MAG: hypothetical protein DI527_00555 [Chelatococcus sp.]